MIQDHKDLIMWQKAMDMTAEVYRLAKLLPREETYALSDQMRRAAVSVPSNIAEGYQRRSDGYIKHFLYIAKGSNAEVETQILLCIRLGYFPQSEAQTALKLIEEIAKMLSVFIGKLADSR